MRRPPRGADSAEASQQRAAGPTLAVAVLPRALYSAVLLFCGGGFAALGLGEEGPARLGGVGVGVAFVVVVLRFWRLRVVLGDSVIIVNWLRTIDIPWVEVERFALDPDGGAWVRRRDMGSHQIAAFGGAMRDPMGLVRDRNGRAVATLEAARKRRRSGGGRSR